MSDKSINYKYATEDFKSNICVVCQETLKTTYRYYCNVCRAVVSEMQADARLAIAAAGIQIAKDTACADCGAPATCLDHRHYSLPLEVDAVCNPCNRKRGPADDVAQIGKSVLARKAGLSQSTADRARINLATDMPLESAINTAERKAIIDALEKTNHNRTAAARRLGISFRAIRYRMEKLDIH